MSPRTESSAYSRIIKGKTVYVYANDHGPPHAHAVMNQDPDGVIRFNLKTCDVLPEFHYNREALRLWTRWRRHVQPYLEEMKIAFARQNPHLHGGQP